MRAFSSAVQDIQPIANRCRDLYVNLKPAFTEPVSAGIGCRLPGERIIVVGEDCDSLHSVGWLEGFQTVGADR